MAVFNIMERLPSLARDPEEEVAALVRDVIICNCQDNLWPPSTVAEVRDRLQQKYGCVPPYGALGVRYGEKFVKEQIQQVYEARGVELKESARERDRPTTADSPRKSPAELDPETLAWIQEHTADPWVRGIFGICMWTGLAGLGWLWHRAARRILANESTAVTVIAVVVYVGLLILGLCLANARHDERKPLLVLVGCVLLTPLAWAAMGALAWAWNNPLF